MTYFHTSAPAIHRGLSHTDVNVSSWFFKALHSFDLQQSLKTSHINPANTYISVQFKMRHTESDF